MSRVSDRTLKIRHIVERIPPERINQISLTDLQEELESAGVELKTDAQRHTVYAELTRRRRRLGKLTPARRKGVKAIEREVETARTLPSGQMEVDYDRLRKAVISLDQQLKDRGSEESVLNLISTVVSVPLDLSVFLHQFQHDYGSRTLIMTAIAIMDERGWRQEGQVEKEDRMKSGE